MSRPLSDDDRSLIERAAHDLLNPISAILGLGETIESRGNGLGDDTIRAFGASIARQAGRLDRAVRDLELTSVLLRGDPQCAIADVPAERLIGSFASDRVRVVFADGLALRADPDLMVGALRRLIENAIEFSEGEVVVRVGETWIEVVDTGIGFTPEGLAHAFEPLSPGTNARNERGSGLGLGLYIARRLVAVQGGTLTATTEPGKGSVFRIDLPA